MNLSAIFMLLLLSAPWQESDATEKLADFSATVNGWHISRTRVERFVDHKMTGRVIRDDVRQRLHREALEHLVRRQVVLEYLKTTRFYRLSQNAIDVRVDVLRQDLRKVDRTLPQYLEEKGMTREELENEISWEISWGKFLENYLNQNRLKQFYDQRRREFDGTRLKVAHLLLRLAEGETVSEVVDRAILVRQKILLGQTTWSDAVKEFSVAKTSIDQDGLIGWISFEGPMPAVFNRPAFQLDPGQTSLPVATATGVHLIRCLDVEPGTLGPQDVDTELRSAASRFIFNQLADQNRSKVKIVYGHLADH